MAKPIMDNFFVVGHTYQNRKGRYTVLGIRSGTLTVRYEDGTLDNLNTEIQKRIISNMSETEPHKKATADNPRIDWELYNLWNQRIFDSYFNTETHNRLVYLNISDEDLPDFSSGEKTWPQPLNNFVNAVLETLDIRRGRLLDQHLHRLRSWKTNGAFAPPPFIGVLALFCLVAQHMKTDEAFHANNYYDRLAELLLGNAYTWGKREDIRFGFEQAQVFWHELEAWLITQGGRFGLPSARPMYGLPHVGYPISQALLRENDREKLPEFFLWAALEPRQDIPPADMERLMTYWVPNSSLSLAAKTSWKNNAAKRRMAEIATLELSAWDGTIQTYEMEHNQFHASSLALEVRIYGGPKPLLQWDIVFRMPPGADEVTYEVTGDGCGLPIDGKYENIVNVTRGLEEQWSEPVQVSIADLLVTRVSMTAQKERLNVIWEPRKVVIFSWNDELKIFRSAQRLEFGSKSVILAYKTIAPKVLDILSSADSGAMRQVPNSWGAPEDWAVFTGVQLIHVPDIGNDTELEPLVPIIWSGITWEGGLALPGRKRWLSSRLPIIRINSIEETKNLAATIQLRSALGDAGEQPISLYFEDSGNALNIDLSARGLTEGVYGLYVTRSSEQYKKDEDLTHQTFEVRSPDLPLNRCSNSFGHRPDLPCWAISASADDPVHADSSHTIITGAFAQPECSISPHVHKLPVSLGSNIKTTQEDQFGSGHILHRTVETMANCFKGAHYWIIAPVTDLADFNRPKAGVCKYCGLHETFPAFHRSGFQSSQSPRQRQEPVTDIVMQSSTKLMILTSETNKHDFDGLLDACFTLGKGSWSQFELLARQVCDDPAFPYEALQLFSALGHIDIQLDPTYTRATQWEIARSTIATTASDKAILAGYRSPRLLKAIEKVVNRMGGEFNSITNEFGPTAYFIIGLNYELLEDIATTINDDFLTELSMCRRPNISIAAQLVPLQTILSAQRILVQPIASEVFDVSKMTWVSWDPNNPIYPDGLYRSDSFPRVYFLKRQDQYFRISYRIGKHLAAAFNNRSLIAYQPQTQQLECPLGGQLPGLYERAVVLSSGLPPILDLHNGKVIYSEVPQEVASTIWAVIYA